ncbi:UNVERIFIED_CONTAM: hypothetical protein RMT77_001993 [Armadillidium vulgare]
MDEVFGNSSTETVVSAQELSNSSMDESILDDEEKTDKNVNDSPSENHESSVVSARDSPSGNKVRVIRETVIKCVGPLNQTQPEDNLFKVPFPPLGPLRHTQSVIVQRPATIITRARAHSTSEAIQAKYNTYQNIPLNIPSLSPKYPSYVNLPGSIIENFSRTHSLGELSSVSSAPSTPRGSHNPKVKKSYIQLWTGSEESVSISDDTISSGGTGYVSMTSPYLRSPNSSLLSELAYHLSSYETKQDTSEIFCPFCARPFIKEKNLKHHIQAIHRHDLLKVIGSKEPVSIQYCPECQSRFFNSDLLPNHLLEFHRDSVLDIVDRSKSLRYSDKEMKCPFCPKKVCISKSGEENMLFHVAQLHCVEFQTLIQSMFKPVECLKRGEALTKLSTEDLARALSFQPGVTSTPGLSLKFKTLNCEAEEDSISGSHTNLESTWNSHCGLKIVDKVETVTVVDQHQIISKGILRSQTDLTHKPSVKRELRFSVPPVTSAEFFIPESPESTTTESFDNIDEHKDNMFNFSKRRDIPIRVDSLSSADFIELTSLPSRKRRRLGVSLKSKSSFKKTKCETTHLVENVFEGLKSIGCSKNSNENVIKTTATRTFRKPKPVPSPKVPLSRNTEKVSKVPPPPSEIRMTVEDFESEIIEPSSFGNMKLYSPLKMFRCNGCRIKYCDNESLGSHIRSKHKGFMGLIRPHFGCGICSAKFYENKYLVKHCLQHHTSLLEIRSPKKNKISIYRFNQD